MKYIIIVISFLGIMFDSCASEYSGQPVWEGAYIQAKES